VVLEILGGVLVGPAILGWVHLDAAVRVTADLGLGFLLFMAGYEIDLRRFDRPILVLVARAFAVSMALAELGPLVLLSVLFSASSGNPSVELGLLAAFVAFTAVVVVVAQRIGGWGPLRPERAGAICLRQASLVVPGQCGLTGRRKRSTPRSATATSLFSCPPSSGNGSSTRPAKHHQVSGPD